MKSLIAFAALLFATSAARAQSPPPTAGKKPLIQVWSQGPPGCKLVGRVKGTKLWAGDCEAALKGPSSIDAAPETNAVPPNEKEHLPPASTGD